MSSSSGNKSGAWETVGKPSKKSSSKGSSVNGKKPVKGAPSVPRMEDVLPLKQVNSWYANAYDTPPSESDDEVAKKNKNSTAEKAAFKASNKKANPSSSKKEAPPLEAKKPSNINDAASLVHASELKAFLNDFKVSYPNLKELWVREISLYLNASLETTEKSPGFLSDPFTDLPASALYRETKKILTSTLEECSGAARLSIFDTHLANVAHYMAKGKSVNGFLTVIQVLLEAFPNICHGNISKFSELRNSYQNQPHICLALLWAVGQGGKHDLKSGLKAWLELMMPLMSLRHYHKFIVSYLSQLLEKHASQMDGRRLIMPAQFMQFLQVFFFHGPASLNKEMTESLQKSYAPVKALALGNGSTGFELFPHLLRRLAAPDSQTNETERKEILSLLQDCIARSHEASLSQWLLMYSSYVPQSAMLLKHLEVHWKDLPARVRSSKDLKETLSAFSSFNITNGSKDGSAKSNASCNVLLSKMLTNESRGWFPWKTICCLLILLISALVQSDLSRHKTLKASNTGMLLSDIGLFNPLTNAFETSRSSLHQGMSWLEKTSPEGMKMAKEGFSTMSDHAAHLSGVLGDKASTGYQSASEYVNTHAPGLKVQVQYWCQEAANSAESLCSWMKKKAPLAMEQVLFYSKKLRDSSLYYTNHLLEEMEKAGVKDFIGRKFQEGSQFFSDTYKRFVELVLKCMER